MLMLRAVQRPVVRPLVQRASLSKLKTNFQVPSTANTILIRNLPETVTSSKLLDAFKEIKFNRCQLQPGCALHFVHNEDAAVAANLLAEKAKLQVTNRLVHLHRQIERKMLIVC